MRDTEAGERNACVRKETVEKPKVVKVGRHSMRRAASTNKAGRKAGRKRIGDAGLVD
ncbi:hypothetical protein GCM10023069_02050 [Shinella granuli]